MGFDQHFLWGAASADYQVEGAYLDDGKGLGIWDALSEGHVKHGDNGNVACDHYHRFREDIALMKQIGLKAYRFSVSWPRVMPEEGRVNGKGVAFYMELVRELTEAGIQPMCTLFHWNLPMWAHEKGGWLWDGISDAFADFARVVVDALSDSVSVWMTLNEPACFIGAGYLYGFHAPFEKHAGDEDRTARLVRNTLLVGDPIRRQDRASDRACSERVNIYAGKRQEPGRSEGNDLCGPALRVLRCVLDGPDRKRRAARFSERICQRRRPEGDASAHRLFRIQLLQFLRL